MWLSCWMCVWEFFAFENAQHRGMIWRIKAHLDNVHEDISTSIQAAFDDDELVDLFTP